MCMHSLSILITIRAGCQNMSPYESKCIQNFFKNVLNVLSEADNSTVLSDFKKKKQLARTSGKLTVLLFSKSCRIKHFESLY